MPALGFEESFNAILALHGHDGFKAALAPPWHHRPREGADRPVARRQLRHRRRGRAGVARCICFYREDPGDNGYARPIEGLLVHVDMARGEVLEVVDHGVVPMPDEPGSYFPEDQRPLRDDLRPLEIIQPDGVGFAVDGNVVRGRGGRSASTSTRSRASCSTRSATTTAAARARSSTGPRGRDGRPLRRPRPGPRLEERLRRRRVGPRADGQLARASGATASARSPTSTPSLDDERGDANTTENAICIHEEDNGILWKHLDLLSGRAEVRRSAAWSSSSIATVGNYEYGF